VGARSAGILWISYLVKVALWSIASLLVIANFGYDVTALIAGLGIGGIAIGLAVQNILSDLFASLSIVLDKGFGESSYDFEVVYYVLDPDFALYMDIQQAVNLKIVRAFAERGIEFAYPTRTLFVEKDEDE